MLNLVHSSRMPGMTFADPHGSGSNSFDNTFPADCRDKIGSRRVL
jgi:hypothetical protein